MGRGAEPCVPEGGTVLTDGSRLADLVRASALEAAGCFDGFTRDAHGIGQIAEAGRLLAESLKHDGKVITCGNGGSMADAIHLAEELSGRFRADRRALAALALSDAGHLTCVGNDFGYDETFARGIEALGRPGDVLVAFSTSGSSTNVLRAVSAAQRQQMITIAVTGKSKTPVEQDAALTIVTPGGRWADRVQELHTFVVHALLEVVEHVLGIDENSVAGDD
jgi:D-sedoheptulose 7-phosphate isomerase